MNARPAFAVAAAAAVALFAVSGCAPGGSNSTSAQEAVTGGQATIAIAADPGTLNPLAGNPSPSSYQLMAIAYDHLVARTADGKFQANLASSWESTPTSAKFVLRDDVKCSDGSALTPSVVAKTFAWVLDKKNSSPWLGAFIPVDAKVTPDDANKTLEVTSATPSSFLLNSLSYMPILCGSGADNPAGLATTTSGTGMFKLTGETPGQSFTFSVRPEYVWGPAGAKASDAGVPATVTVKIVANEATRANLLISGDVNVTALTGADRDRLKNQNLSKIDIPANPGLIFFNQAAGRVGADKSIRSTLSQALDLKSIASVASGGRGQDLKSIVTGTPSVCSVDTISGNVPSFDAESAKKALDAAGWKAGSDGLRSKDGKALQLKFLYPSNRGTELVAAAELIQKELRAIGADLTLVGSDNYASVLFSGGDWDIVWGPFSTEDPSVWTILVNGAAPPNGRNFASIQNATYQAKTNEAVTNAGEESCPLWGEAEAALIKDNDILPVVANTQTIYGNKAKFNLGILGSVDATSIRMSK
ncbi:peptide ABC transporter substrate-binding protein [Arthrobacter sp. MYb23]|uniref:ABC transporter substrate-binding protein n=1 Tax=unclassified Arthrobacter TaxID=235627 RepID=UPI000CFA9A84|nr:MULTISPECIES: ABC transporter substrate-binding protein [unclassified Arthrobacter]PRB43058.1 peptide ABC transporter substrate-binding protein [Arthrobacter sp. MYb51]PRB98010.1 peptide ABC transporter substrate-binding protein [Arthrobacter sp. MYb23]